MNSEIVNGWWCFTNIPGRRKIPAGLAGIYVAVEMEAGMQVVRYVGQSVDVSLRIRSSLADICIGGHIFVYPEYDKDRRNFFERTLIHYHQPSFNVVATNRHPNQLRSYCPSPVYDAGEWDWLTPVEIAQQWAENDHSYQRRNAGYLLAPALN